MIWWRIGLIEIGRAGWIKKLVVDRAIMAFGLDRESCGGGGTPEANDDDSCFFLCLDLHCELACKTNTHPHPYTHDEQHKKSAVRWPQYKNICQYNVCTGMAKSDQYIYILSMYCIYCGISR